MSYRALHGKKSKYGKTVSATENKNSLPLVGSVLVIVHERAETIVHGVVIRKIHACIVM